MPLLSPGFAKFAKLVLVFLNFILLLLAIGLIVVSAVLYRSGDIATDNNVLVLFDQLTISYDITVGSVITKIVIGILVVAIILFLVTLLGFLGIFYRSVPVLALFGILVIMICGFQIFVIYLWFKLRDEVTYTVKDKMLSLLSHYEGNTGTKSITKAWNNLFLWFDCCGVNPVNEVDDFTGTTWNTTRGADKVPGYCCRDAMKNTAASFSGAACTVNPTLQNAWLDKGCYTAVSDYLKSYSDGFLSCSFIILFIGIFVAFLAFLFAFHERGIRRNRKYSKRSEKEPIGAYIPEGNCNCAPCHVHDVNHRCTCPPVQLPMWYPPYSGYIPAQTGYVPAQSGYFPASSGYIPPVSGHLARCVQRWENPPTYRYDPRLVPSVRIPRRNYREQTKNESYLQPTSNYFVDPQIWNPYSSYYPYVSYGDMTDTQRKKRTKDYTYYWNPSDDARDQMSMIPRRNI
ncbi:uncharacterized protein LOC134722152 [Mytilus trossulus]|uniref:uncharacterized protein LOC134722152 n=1 Tax=Mytilus trossulus TaxID=6551 RepID=UPI003004177D